VKPGPTPLYLGDLAVAVDRTTGRLVYLPPPFRPFVRMYERWGSRLILPRMRADTRRVLE